MIQAAFKILERENVETVPKKADDETETPSKPLPPCRAKKTEEKAKGNGRRAIGVAQNPYTGQLQYVAYPSYSYGYVG